MHERGMRGKGMSGKGMSGQREMYVRLAVMVAVSLVWMYGAMFAMVSSAGDIFQNLNFAYMAGLMGGAMIPIEIVVMRAMYKDARLNVVAAAVAIAILGGSFLGIRAQVGVGDDQFLRAMIPHHSSAILMCQQASIQSAEIKELCFGPNAIVESQLREIAQMKEILSRR